MANWCYFDVCLKGNFKDIADLFLKANYAEKKSHETKKWASFELFREFGFTEEEIDSPNFCFTGGNIIEISTPEFNGDEYYFYIRMELRWSPLIESFEKLREKYPDVTMLYFAEEPGFEIYINTDKSHEYFSTKYCVVDDGESHYFDDDRSLRDYIYNETGLWISDFNKLEDKHIVMNDLVIYRYSS